MILRKMTTALLVSGVLLSAAGCQLPSRPADEAPVSVGSDKIEEHKYLSAYRNNWQYRYLSSNEKDCYGAIFTVLTDQFEQDVSVSIEDNGTTKEYTGVSIALPHPLHSQEDAQRLYNAFFRDNPQFFYVGNRYGLEGYVEKDIPHYDTLLLVYTMNATDRRKATERLEEAAQNVLREKPQTTDDYITELYLHDHLANACTYDTAAAKEGNDTVYPNAYTAYGALVDGKAVCEGYSRAMQYLLLKAGIPCTLVTGTSRENGEEHMWNLLTVNGRNYHLDVTWNDSEDRLTHTFMNLTTARLNDSHILDEGQAGVDTCAATQDDYFIRNGTYIDTYHREDIAKVIAAVVLDGADTVELRFAADKFNNGLLFLKNAALTSQMVNAALHGTGHGDTELWEYQLYGRPEQHTLTLIKK